MRLDSDVRKFLEESKRKYDGLDMTEVVHFAVRHVRDEKILSQMFKTKEEKREKSPTNNEEDQTGGSEVDNKNPTENRKKDPSGGVRFSDISRMEEEESAGENEDTRG